MEFRLETINDLPQIKTVYKEIVQDMYKRHIDIWDEIYPCDFFEEDIKQDRIYIYLQDFPCGGFFIFLHNHSVC